MRYFLRDQKGATAVEYGVILAVVVLILLGGLMLLGDASTGQITSVADKTSKAM